MVVTSMRGEGRIRPRPYTPSVAEPADPRGARTEQHERVGVLGGTFDPPHVAHLELADAAREQFDLDRVIFVVAGDPWQKSGQVVAAGAERLAMVEAALADRPGFEASAIEIERPGPTYTAETLEELARPDRELYLIVGADVAAGLDTWHEPDRVRGAATILVADRPGASGSARQVTEELVQAGWRCAVVDLPPRDVSSTDVRRRLADAEPPGDSLPPPVVRVVEERGLYTRP